MTTSLLPLSLRRGTIALVTAAVVLGVPGFAAMAQDATPETATPVAEEQAQPVATAPATTNVETLVAWYANEPGGEFLVIHPLGLEDDIVASLLQVRGEDAEAIGKVEFPDEGYPVITLGETTFNAYPRYEGDVAERWTWFDDVDGVRPATMVMQIEGVGGEYDRHYGTATFVSRDEGGVGGVIVFALRPPADAAEEAQAATETTPEATAEATKEATAEATATEEPAATEAPTEPAATEKPGATPVANS